MSLTTVNFVVSRVEKAERRWMAAMLRPGYRDDPDEADLKGKPFTEQDWILYNWADNWRLICHRYENALDRLPEASMSRSRESRKGVEHVQYIVPQTWNQLSALCPEFKLTDKARTKPRSRK